MQNPTYYAHWIMFWIHKIRERIKLLPSLSVPTNTIHSLHCFRPWTTWARSKNYPHTNLPATCNKPPSQAHNNFDAHMSLDILQYSHLCLCGSWIPYYIVVQYHFSFYDESGVILHQNIANQFHPWLDSPLHTQYQLLHIIFKKTNPPYTHISTVTN